MERSADGRHPASRFAAPSSITAGLPMKHMFDRAYLTLLAESFACCHDSFDTRRFIRRANKGLVDLELMSRASHIASALREELPQDFDEMTDVLIRSLGPPLAQTAGNGLAPFFYLPHSCLIAEHGIRSFASAMRANYELTQRFSAEFSIRPLIAAFPKESLRMLLRWTRDASAHVRRLVSEGSRPRLPWGMRLKVIQENPALTLPLLEKLKDDSSMYVRKSVANHLGDLLKDHPDVVYETCERWTGEAFKRDGDPEARKARLWIVRHAVRLPAKKGEQQALVLRQRASGKA